MTSLNPDFSGMLPPEQCDELNKFPPALRELLFAELSAGNSIAEIGHSFPAAPAGAYVLLANDVHSRERASTAGISFYERNTLQFFGEYADEKRHFFVLESPHAPEPDPDINKIRAALQPPPYVDITDSTDAMIGNVASHDDFADTRVTERMSPRSAQSGTERTARAASSAPQSEPMHTTTSAYARFAESRTMNYDRWRDGIGYDLNALAEMTPDERKQVEPTFIPAQDWRDVEALVALQTEAATDALIAAAHADEPQLRLAVLSRAPHLFTDALKTETLLLAIEAVAPFAGLSAALDAVEEFHPVEVQVAMFNAALNRGGDIAYHMGTSLAVIHGKISSRFDWGLRPMMLKLNTEDTTERGRAFLWLCDLLNIKDKPEFAEVTKMIATVKRLRKL